MKTVQKYILLLVCPLRSSIDNRMQTSSKSLNWNLNNQVDMKFCNLMLNIQYLKISISVCFLTMSYCQFWSTNSQYVNNLFNTKNATVNVTCVRVNIILIWIFFLLWVVSTLQWNQFYLFTFFASFHEQHNHYCCFFFINAMM